MENEENRKTIEKKIYALKVHSNKSIDDTFDKISQKVNNDYSELEDRGLIYTHAIDKFKYFLDVKPKIEYDKKNENGKLTVYNCILYKLREDEFPFLFNIATGEKELIPSTDKNTIMEQTHFIVIPELNVILSEYNSHGARVSNRLLFLVDKILGPQYSDGFRVDNILDYKTSMNIRNMKKIKKLQFKAGHQGMKTINKYLHIGVLDTISGTFDNSEELEFEITIRGKGKINSKNSKNIELPDLEKFKELCDKILKDGGNELDIQKARILDPTVNRALPIDLFQEYLISTVTAIKLTNRSKYIDSIDMFKKILEVYNNNEFELSNFIKIEI